MKISIEDKIKIQKLKQETRKFLNDYVHVVRCENCIYYHSPHVLLDDGTELSYDSERVKEYIKKRNERRELFSDFVGIDLGINVGGKCEYEKNTGYDDDKTVYRNEKDFCSRGKRK